MTTRLYIGRFSDGARHTCEAESLVEAALAFAGDSPLTGRDVSIEVIDAETGESETLCVDIAERHAEVISLPLRQQKAAKPAARRKRAS
jgi:hypothetical protein